MTVEMHLSGVHEAIFLREKDADAFITEYRAWVTDQSREKIFEFYHNGSIHCFALSAVSYLKIKLHTETETRELAQARSILAAGGASVRH